MRFRIYCCCGGKENSKTAKSRKSKESTTKPPSPTFGESIQLERITELSRRTSNEKANEPSNRSESPFASSSTTPITQFTTQPILPSVNVSPTVSASSNFNYVAKNGEQTTMSFDQVEPNHYRGSYKGSKFRIVDGELKSADGAFTDLDKKMILRNHSQAILAMQQGMLGIEAKLIESLNQQLPSLNHRQLAQLTIPVGSKINVNFTAECGEKSKMTFKQIQPGLFRGTYNDKVFSIANGQVLTLNGADRCLNKELILGAFYRALLGMQQTKLGLQQGEWAIEARLSGSQLNPMELLKAACPERRALFETESLQVHNEFRKIHGVPPLTHSEFLCEIAREWAEHLALKDKSYKRPNNEYGENLYYSHGVNLDARTTVTAWYDEINLYNFNEPEFSKDTGHFTQLVWRDTKEMGTGIAQLGDKVWVCCYYHPAGNITSKFNEKYVPRPRGDTKSADVSN